MTSTPIVSRETCRLRRTPVVSRETAGVFAARRAGATSSCWAMSSHEHPSATTPNANSALSNQQVPPRDLRTRRCSPSRSAHQRGHSSATTPTARSATSKPRLATQIRRSLHQRGALTYEERPSAGGFTNKGHPPANPLRHRPRQLRAVDSPRDGPRLAARARASAPWRGANTQARAKNPMSTKTIVAPVGTSMDHER